MKPLHYLIIVLLCGCVKTSTFSLDQMNPGRSATAVIGEVVSLEQAVLTVKIISRKAGGPGAPTIYGTGRNTDFVITPVFKRFYEEKFNESLEEYLNSTKRIAFYCEKGLDTKDFQITEIIRDE